MQRATVAFFTHPEKGSSPSRCFEYSSLWASVDDAWAMWCSDIEKYLVQAGLVDSKKPERKAGDVPTVRVGFHRMGATQSP